MRLFCLLSILLLFLSCEKNRGVIETQLVVTKINRSIPTDHDVVGFDSFSEDDIFAFGVKNGDVALYITSNGGQTWTAINDPFTGNSISSVQSVVYLNEQNLALVVNDNLYRSFDGGENWSVTNEFFLPLKVFFAAKYNNKLIAIENEGLVTNRIFSFAYNSHVFTQMGTLPAYNINYDKGHLNENCIMFLSYDNDFADDQLHGYDLLQQSHILIPIYSSAFDKPLDAMKYKGSTMIGRQNGIIDFVQGTDPLSPSGYYNYHDEDYRSIADCGEFLVAVGDRTISTNFNGKWEEALEKDCTGQKNTFYKVLKCDESHFYISGENGLFIKASF